MEPIYRRSFVIEDIHTDCNLRLKPSTLLYFIQEAAGSHCNALQISWEELQKQNLFWAVIRNRTQITRLPRSGETITLETWPMPTTRVAYPRSVIAYDAQGKECFRSVSLWVLMDSASRAMVLPGKSGVTVNGLLRGSELQAPGSLAPKPLSRKCSRCVHYSLLDRNGHMNNTRYLDWVCDLLPAAFHESHTPREFTICYLNEARENQQVELNWEVSPEGLLQVDAYRENTDVPQEKHRVFSVQMLFGGEK